MAFRWHADDEPTLNAGLVVLWFQGIRTSIAKKTYNLYFCDLFGGGGSEPLSPLWIRACQAYDIVVIITQASSQGPDKSVLSLIAYRNDTLQTNTRYREEES